MVIIGIIITLSMILKSYLIISKFYIENKKKIHYIPNILVFAFSAFGFGKSYKSWKLNYFYDRLWFWIIIVIFDIILVIESKAIF